MNLGRTLVPINVIAWGVGIAGVAAGAYLFLTSGKSTEQPQPRTAAAQIPTIVPRISAAGGGLSVEGSF